MGVVAALHLRWIKRKQREFEGQARQSDRQYVSGETHYVFGKPLRLLVHNNGSSRHE
ncbi:YgjP-like metallopeptidase domain-containing protein, partial [Pseudotabrizicola sp. L79]|uniref:YgjP-like metallopeptidase domain-containing protein n=1 Tax=Pseudotabrizicola sp. L79 TaxID=3118402 RepID=UPI004053BC3B